MMSLPISFEEEEALMEAEMEAEATQLPCSTINVKSHETADLVKPIPKIEEEDLPALMAKKARLGGVEGAKVPARKANGERIWFEKKAARRHEPAIQPRSYASPIFQMIREIEAEGREQARRRPPVYGSKSEEDAHSKADELWVDKYAPRKFTDLVSQDRCNIEALKWVGQWRDCEKDPGKRPEKSILLIAGPPGLGKTTLVQVIASVCNYNLIEINASDDRGGEGVIQRIRSAITSDAIGGRSQSKPNLVLIDEIDGAANTASETGLIKFLVGLDAKKSPGKASEKKDQPVDDEEEDEGVNEDTAAPSKGKKTPKGVTLCRPIICVCNDLYVPALKPLRLAAQVITLKQPSPLHLAQRLRQVCELEAFKVDGRNLADLAEAMEGDLRACLHALQFLAATRKQIVGAGELLRCIQASGLKDIRRSSFALLQAVFHKPSSADALATEQLIKDLSAEEDRFLEGCHEAFLQTKFFDDAAMTKVNAALGWLSTADLWRASPAQPHLQRYTHYAPLKFRQLFASPTRAANIAFPRADFEVQQRTRAAQQILRTFLAGLPPSVLASWGPTSCLIDRAPYLLGLIKPRIRVPNPQLLKPGERIHLDRIVQIMANEGLTYRETKGSTEDNNSNYFFVLDPPIDVLVHLANPLAPTNQSLHPSHHHDSAIRKLVAHLVQQENIKRSQGHHKPVKSLPAEPAVKKIEAPKVKVEPAASVIKRDFFGRPIIPKHAPATQQEAPSSEPSNQPRVFYKFNEGFSNAVRRTIRIRDLFGASSNTEQ